jgi:hypothetical protein
VVLAKEPLRKLAPGEHQDLKLGDASTLTIRAVGTALDWHGRTVNGADPAHQLTAPVDNTGGADFDMTLFKAEVTDGVAAELDDQAVWVEQDGTAEEGGLEIIRGRRRRRHLLLAVLQ